VKVIQARARGMRDRQRVAQIKEEKECAAREAAEAAQQLAEELAATDMFSKPSTAPSPLTKPLPVKPGGISKSGTVGPGASAKPPARRQSLSKADTDAKSSHSATRRASFDKNQDAARARRGSFGEDGTSVQRVGSGDQERSHARRASFDKEGTSVQRVGSGDHARRASFDKEGPSVHRVASGDQERSHTRRASFDKEKEYAGGAGKPAAAANARAVALEREKDKAGSKSVHSVGGTGKAAVGKTGAGPTRRGTAPAHTMDAPRRGRMLCGRTQSRKALLKAVPRIHRGSPRRTTTTSPSKLTSPTLSRLRAVSPVSRMT
jgi:hypothetical protein